MPYSWLSTQVIHLTTRENEFQRGRIGEVALMLLERELRARVDQNRKRAFVALMHHHPIPHQKLDLPQGRIDMFNGAELMQILEETGVSWLVIHGHKHHGRLVVAQGGLNSPVVFAAGSFGAFLDGVYAMKTRQQFYILEVDLCDQTIKPSAAGHVRAWSWTGHDWEQARALSHGLPDRCGYRRGAALDQEAAVDVLMTALQNSGKTFFTWEEALVQHPDLRFLLPDDAKHLRRLMQGKGLKVTWDEGDWLPGEVGR